jgi:hypothetical protein
MELRKETKQMDGFNSFLHYKSYATVQAVGWVFLFASFLVAEYGRQSNNKELDSFFTNIVVYTVLLFTGIGFVHMWIQFFQ